MSQEPRADLASVVQIPPRMEMWPKVVDTELFAQLHTKFWGKSMADEEQKSLEGQDVDDPMVEDQDETIDADDDFIPGCYALDIDIQGLPLSRIWIRAD